MLLTPSALYCRKGRRKKASVLHVHEADGRVTFSELRTAESLIFILWVFLKKWSAAEAMRRQGFEAYGDLFAFCQGHPWQVEYSKIIISNNDKNKK